MTDVSSQAMVPIAATVFGEGSNQDYKTKVRIASSILNRFESGKKEFGADTGSITNVLKTGYSSARDNSKQYTMAMNQDFPDKESERSFKESLGIVSGLMKGHIQRGPEEFILTDQDVKDVTAKKLMDMGKLENLGKSGGFNFFSYKKAPAKALKNMSDRKITSNPVQ